MKAGKAHGHAAKSGIDLTRTIVLHLAPCPASLAVQAMAGMLADLRRDNLLLSALQPLSFVQAQTEIADFRRDRRIGRSPSH
jgi:hypothetical protein